MCIYIYTHLHIHMHLHKYVYIYICIHVYLHPMKYLIHLLPYQTALSQTNTQHSTWWIRRCNSLRSGWPSLHRNETFFVGQGHRSCQSCELEKPWNDYGGTSTEFEVYILIILYRLILLVNSDGQNSWHWSCDFPNASACQTPLQKQRIAEDILPCFSRQPRICRSRLSRLVARLHCYS